MPMLPAETLQGDFVVRIAVHNHTIHVEDQGKRVFHRCEDKKLLPRTGGRNQLALPDHHHPAGIALAAGGDAHQVKTWRQQARVEGGGLIGADRKRLV